MQVLGVNKFTGPVSAMGLGRKRFEPDRVITREDL